MDLKTFLFHLIVIYISARLLGEVAGRMGTAFGPRRITGRSAWSAPSLLGLVQPTEILTLLGEIGVMPLLFEVGLELDLQAFLKVGPSAAVVALIGVAAPFGLGYVVATLLHLTQLQSIFIGATLTATSVAISARVLSDLGQLKSREGTIILGAAVLDDILGLVLCRVMVGLAQSGSVSWTTIALMRGLAVVFLVTAMTFGNRYAAWLQDTLVNRLNTRGSLVSVALTFALLLGYVAKEVCVVRSMGRLPRD